MGRQTPELFLFHAFSPLDDLCYFPGMLGMRIWSLLKGYTIPYHYLLRLVQGMFYLVESPKCQKNRELFKHPTN